MVDTFERPHSSAFGAYSRDKSPAATGFAADTPKAVREQAAASAAVQLMHHKRLMIDG